MKGVKFLYRLIVLASFIGAGLAQGQTVMLPHVGHGQGFQATINFVNLSTTTNRVALYAFDSEGNPANFLKLTETPFEEETAADEVGVEIAGLGSAIAETHSLNPAELLIGYIRVEAEAPVGIEVVFRRFEGNRLLTTTSVLPQPLSEAFSLIGHSGDFARSGLALLNPSSSQSASVEISLYDKFGDRIGERQLELAPGAKIARFLHENEFFSELSETDFLGSADVRSSVPIAVTVIKVEGSDGFFTTQTVQPPRQID